MREGDEDVYNRVNSVYSDLLGANRQTTSGGDMIFIPVVASLWYCAGELWSKFIKYSLGVPIAVISVICGHTYLTGLAIVISYFIATQFGYGENNWLTKLLGNKGAITFCGFALGLASWPILGFFALLQALLSAGVWYWLSTKDGVIDEPWVGLIRGLSGTILMIGG